MSERKQVAQARAAQVAALRAAQAREERAKRFLVYSGVAILLAVLIAAVAWVITREAARRAELEQAAQRPIAGVVETADLSRSHIDFLPEPTPAQDGTFLPPVGGDHEAVWQNCGVYDEPIRAGNAIHSLEHGAVWVTYAPELDAAQIDTLEDIVGGRPFTLLSPFTDQTSPIVLTAWGIQLQVDSADDARIPVFLEKYVQGAQTPEPGAACSGGVGTPS